MENLCSDNQFHHQHQNQKHHPSHQLYLNKKFREVDIPPRKLLSRRGSSSSGSPIDPYEFLIDSPKSEESTMFQKFLPCNNINADDDEDPYSADHFRMYEFKVRKCNRSRSHDWTDCPFAHPGEKARRRDPRRYNYTGTVCPEFRRGNCSRGDSCEFAHGVFECWLHPSRYRTEACKDGKKCKRKVCFFAHTPRQLRLSPIDFQENEFSPTGTHNSSINSIEKHPTSHPHQKQCCVYCHTFLASPTSTLVGVGGQYSPPASPPYSPARISPVSRFSSGLSPFGYKDTLSELINNFEAMNVNDGATIASPISGGANHGNLSWVDVNFNVEDQPQFVLSPSTPGNLYNNPTRNFMEGDDKNNDNALASGPDFEWVNDLLT
ncbi:hypothetical protein LIER_14132 [Lithospermum erythrorhizon]|uniref:C3H1-type domain-containing protein n=1 Tax=Lithospermum erythrorhizon TaxID=34254 RepID=A0AAV3PY43_LITER